jgi:hypothetical protein
MDFLESDRKVWLVPQVSNGPTTEELSTEFDAPPEIPENFLDIISNTHALFCKRLEANLSFLFPSNASFSLEDGHPFNEIRDTFTHEFGHDSKIRLVP